MWTHQAEIACKFSIQVCQVIWHGFLHSQGSTTQYEANKSNQLSEEEATGLRSVKILRDLRDLCLRGLMQDVAVARERAQVSRTGLARSRSRSRYEKLVDRI